MIQLFYFTQINILGKLAVNGSPVVGPKKHHSGTSAALRQLFYFTQINKTPFAAKGITVF
jgi:hypothetical protein